jgi:isoquinoline 1-oxidoreductase beta subunit
LGLAFFFSHAGHVAEVAEVSVAADKRLTVHDVWVAADVGQVINLSGVENQIEGSVVDGLSAMADQRITIREGRIQETNFDTLPALENAKGAEGPCADAGVGIFTDWGGRAGAAAFGAGRR